jgi:serine protease
MAAGCEGTGTGTHSNSVHMKVTKFRLAASAAATGVAALIVTAGPLGAGVAQAGQKRRAPDYVPGEVVVGYATTPAARAARATATTMGLRESASVASTQEVLHLPVGANVTATISRLRRTPGVVYAVPDFLAHIAGSSSSQGWIPDDPGRIGRSEGWEKLQWNFLSGAGVNAPAAWKHLRADGRPGGRGVVVAIVDTGVAYRRWQVRLPNGHWRQFRPSPDFNRTRFVDPYDFVAHNAYPLDREGHGTFVAGTVAESTNNGIGVTGLAYGATIMPVRVLNQNGLGDAATISRGIRYAVNHGAQVINLSLEFGPGVTSSQIPDIISAVRYAHHHGVMVVAAAGNDGENQVVYPARAPGVVSVGATTEDRCLADYSNDGRGLDLVAPGGGDDSSTVRDPDCDSAKNLPGIFQMTFPNPSNPRQFGLPGGWAGTSMSAPHVAAAAALVIASGVLGHHPSPNQVLARLEATAKPLGGSKPNATYGYGLVDAGAATARSTR